MARPRKKYKQNIIAADAGVNPQGLSNILRGHRNASWPLSRRLEAATGISAVYWADGKVDHEFLEKHYAKARRRSFRSGSAINNNSRSKTTGQ